MSLTAKEDLLILGKRFMKMSATFARVFFLLLSVLLITVYTIASSEGSFYANVLRGVFGGVLFGLLLIGTETLFRRFNLRAFNTTALGLFFGYLMGSVILLLLDSVLSIAPHAFDKGIGDLIRVGVFLFGANLGLMMTIRASEEIAVSIPFIKFKPTSQKKKDLLLDSSVVADPRLIDLAASGLLDKHLIMPRFVLKELYEQAEKGDENAKAKGRRSLEVLKKLEGVPGLDLSFNETDFPEVKETMEKLVRLGRLLDANILTADINRVQMSMIEGVRMINIHALSNALKPIMQAGEYLKIKVQRFGKEAKQGVGYLDDGTMVVINGGGDYIGEIIKAQVLSVKHTSSGRMIFCNANEPDMGRLSSERYADEAVTTDAFQSS